ncbi:hypothetical protein [Vannielia litorea]|uniref:Uncharacterized protein n=1 Tax=Vannielia litorea TaxID=1217970 RepID=A0A1N6ICR7_9RHOB|nr:hypothetical protein [Vannielia litorea]SIO29761.1 hypothetical protein SAMN05444002_3705 [Vannielia litorea]
MSRYHPAPLSTPPGTLVALRDWMLAEGANFEGYALDGRGVGEGFSVRHDGAAWLWGNEERGQWREVARFETEAGLAAHAWAEIAADDWAWSHLVVMTDDAERARVVAEECRARGLVVFTDSIPYGGPDDPRHRVFVFGRGIDAVADLVQRDWI